MPSGELLGLRDWLSRWFDRPSPEKNGWGRFRIPLICLVIFFTSVAVRLLYFQDMRAEILYEESLATTLVYKYEEEKQRMYSDGGLLFPARKVDPADARMLFHPPGHSILLAALYGSRTPESFYTSLRLLQVFCGALASVVIALIAAELLPPVVALIAGMLAAISPHFAYHSQWLAPDSLCILPILLSVYLLVRAYKRPRLLMVAAAGLMLGLSVWLRTNALLLAPFLALMIALLFERGKRLVHGAAFVCAAALVISPITIRNWIVYDRFVPVTLGNGLLLVEGIGEYDRDGRFGMAAFDGQVCLLDAEWHARRDYRDNLWIPDGIDRDHARFARGLEVLRKNPVWSLDMMLRRMAFMVRYNDYRPTPLSVRTSRAPSVSWTPPFGHDTEISDGAEPALAGSPLEWACDLGNTPKLAVTPTEDPQAIQVSGRGVTNDEMFISSPLSLKEHTDYLLRVQIGLERGKSVVQVKSDDLRLSLGEKAVTRREEGAAREESASVEIPFTSAHQTSARVVVRADSAEAAEASVRIGRMELFELGPTPYQWTRPARAVTRALQQNIFKTDYMRVLIVVGMILLGLGRRWRALLILLAVPLCYLLSHWPFGIDYRYTLPMHYFLFVCAAVTLYCAAGGLAQLFRPIKQLRTR